MTGAIGCDDSRHCWRAGYPQMTGVIVSRTDAGGPLAAVVLNADPPGLRIQDRALEQPFASPENTAAVQGKLFCDLIPAKCGRAAVPAVGLADDPQENAPLGSAQARMQERAQQFRGQSNKPIRMG